MPRARVTVMADTDQQDPQEGPGKALTCIRECIRCVATQEPDGNEEFARIEVNIFMDTLTDIANAIARRK